MEAIAGDVMCALLFGLDEFAWISWKCHLISKSFLDTTSHIFDITHASTLCESLKCFSRFSFTHSQTQFQRKIKRRKSFRSWIHFSCALLANYTATFWWFALSDIFHLQPPGEETQKIIKLKKIFDKRTCLWKVLLHVNSICVDDGNNDG